MINEVQLERVLALQGAGRAAALLGQLLVDRKLVTAHELNVVLGKYRREHLLGDILVETNLVTSAPARDRARGASGGPAFRSARR